MNYDRADELITGLWTVFPLLFRLIRRGWQKGSKDGLSVYHYETLGFLMRDKRLSMSAIGKVLGVAKSNLTPIVDALVRKGLVARNIDASDRRVIHISLTSKGQKFMDEGKKRAKEDLRKLFGHLNDRDLRALVASFVRLSGTLSHTSL